MIADMPQRVAKRTGYPSAKWQAAQLPQGFQRRLRHLRQPAMGVCSLFLVVVVVCVPLLLLLAEPSILLTVVGAITLLTGAPIAGLVIYALVQSGKVVEGQIVSVTDDGIDRYYIVYFECGSEPYEIDFKAKRDSSVAQLQRGDSLSLMVGRPPGLLPQVLFLRPADVRSLPVGL